MKMKACQCLAEVISSRPVGMAFRSESRPRSSEGEVDHKVTVPSFRPTVTIRLETTTNHNIQSHVILALIINIRHIRSGV